VAAFFAGKAAPDSGPRSYQGRDAAATPHRARLEVGEGRPYRTISAALAAARSGDTVWVRAGVYREHPVISTSVTLLGDPGAVIDGGGEGVVLTVRASSTIRGLTLRGSGHFLSREDAGILVLEADDVRIEGNRLTDVLFGIYVKQSRAPLILANSIEGKDLPLPRRGDGIRLWYCRGGRIADNRIRRTRDVVIWFSNGLVVRGNRITDARYSLHYMYSNHNMFEENRFVGNRVGGFIMYSSGVRFRNNVFAEAAGATGMGLGIKDSDEIRAEGNVFVRNTIGLFLDNSPSRRGVTNRFEGNTFALNDVGVELLPSVHDNFFRANTLVDNRIPVLVSGGGDALANRWSGNYWSEYVGFDANEDGIGDTPFVHSRLADDLIARHQALRLYALSPAMATLDVIGRMFPLLAPRPVVVDSAPRIHAAIGRPGEISRKAWPLAAAFVTLTIAAGAGSRRLRRSLTRVA